MRSKVREKEESVRLRKQGYSYNDILKKVPVARSSISLWLKDLPLTKKEKRCLKRRRDKNISHGRIKAAAAHRTNRLEREKVIFKKAQKEFGQYIGSPLFQVGIGLYWAEGARRNTFFAFSNSDYRMINIMLIWIQKYLGVDKSAINARLYIHKTYAHENCELFWEKHTGIPMQNFRKTIYKPDSKLVKKRPNYKGVLRIAITTVEPLKKVKMWIQMLSRHYNES